MLSDAGLHSSCYPILRNVFELISWFDWSTNPRSFFENPRKQKTKNQSSIQIMDHMEITLTVLQRFVTFNVTYYVIKMSNDTWIIFRQSIPLRMRYSMFTRNLLSQWTEKQKYLRRVSFRKIVIWYDSFLMNHTWLARKMKPKKRMIEFLALASSSLLKLGQENVHTSPNRESIYLLLGDIVKSSKVRILCYYITNHYVTKHDVMISLVNYVTDTIT